MTPFADVSTLAWVMLVVAAALVGFAKTAIGGVGLLSVAIFAAILPARESTGALLPLLLVGDVFAVGMYRRDVDWSRLVRLLPSVVVGLLVGFWFLSAVGDEILRRTIGILVLALVVVHLLWRRRGAEALAVGGPTAIASGATAGFTTMVANAGGPVMSIYLLASGLDVRTFVGTSAAFFFIVNLVKVPFSISLGLLTPATVWGALALAPAVAVGAWSGRRLIDRIPRDTFEAVVLVFIALAGLNLLR